MREEQAVLEHEPDAAPLRRCPGDVGAADQDRAGGGRPHAGHRLEHQALAGAARAEQHDVAAVAHLEIDRPHREAAGVGPHSAQLDHGAPVFERRRLGTRNMRTSRNTTNATMTMSTAGGRAALRPKPSNRSNVRTEITLGL